MIPKLLKINLFTIVVILKILIGYLILLWLDQGYYILFKIMFYNKLRMIIYESYIFLYINLYQNRDYNLLVIYFIFRLGYLN